MNNSFLKQFCPNTKFSYLCFDRVMSEAISAPFFAAGVVRLLRALGFKQITTGVMRILTDQLNAHIEKVAKQKKLFDARQRQVLNHVKIPGT